LCYDHTNLRYTRRFHQSSILVATSKRTRLLYELLFQCQVLTFSCLSTKIKVLCGILFDSQHLSTSKWFPGAPPISHCIRKNKTKQKFHWAGPSVLIGGSISFKRRLSSSAIHLAPVAKQHVLRLLSHPATASSLSSPLAAPNSSPGFPRLTETSLLRESRSLADLVCASGYTPPPRRTGARPPSDAHGG
jgi:hypothetical protein